MVDARLVVSGIKVLIGDRLAIDRSVLGSGSTRAEPAAAELHVRREEHDERNNDDPNDYDPKPILMAANCSEHKAPIKSSGQVSPGEARGQTKSLKLGSEKM